MRGLIKNRLDKVGKDKRGFTLIEMLVVVGIIVALAAIIVPLVISFAGKGEEGAQVGELETLQTAIQAMMVFNDLTGVVASASAGTVTNSFVFDAGPPQATLQDFMDQVETKYCYTWAATGRILTQLDEKTDAGACGAELFPNPP